MHRNTAIPYAHFITDLVLFELLSLGRIEAEVVRRLLPKSPRKAHPNREGRPDEAMLSPIRGRWAIPAFPTRGQFPLLFHFALTWVLLLTLHQLV